MRWRLIGGRLDRHANRPDGAPETLALRVSLRATEIMSIDTRIATEGVRLLAGGRQFSVARPLNVPLFASQSADLNDLLFVVPADLRAASLQLGTIDGSSALMPLVLPE